MRREKLERLVTAGMIEGKRSMEKIAIKDVEYTNKVVKRLKVGPMTGALKATSRRDTWKVMITYSDVQGAILNIFKLKDRTFLGN